MLDVDEKRCKIGWILENLKQSYVNDMGKITIILHITLKKKKKNNMLNEIFQKIVVKD